MREMKCEEFEAIGLDAARDSSLSEAARATARKHADTCSRCAALQDSWQAARVELHAFREATAEPQAPPRVEMRLRQEFRTQHRTLRVRRAAVITAWALATAAVLVGAVSWRNWQKSRHEEAARRLSVPQNPGTRPANSSGAETNGVSPAREATGPEQQSSLKNESSTALVADNELNDFTLLPGVLAAEADNAAIVRVRMQRGALGALGLPVNEERAGEWIQVDLLVGDDGLPQAVRLPQQ
jgi:hypothetical protein